LIKPEVIGPAVREPPEAVVKNRLVVEAVVAKRLVEVLLVVVEFTPVKFWRVDEPVTRRLLAVNRPVDEMEPKVPFVANKFVEVAFVVVEFDAVKF